jgi:hypothetical protein
LPGRTEEDAGKNQKYLISTSRYEPDTYSITRNPFGQNIVFLNSDLKVIQPIMVGSSDSNCGGRLIFPTKETWNIILIKVCLIFQ